jgi:2-keto-4-pentenoate hydratase/2-oxohepta-3-ene-1,7-dioic acid hydratase in catechol pathway
MRVAAVRDGERSWIGEVDKAGLRIQEIRPPYGEGRDPMIRFLEQRVRDEKPEFVGEARNLADLLLLSPVRWPTKNVICVGKNYRAHAAEFSGSGYDSSSSSPSDVIPEAPILFSKAPCCLTGATADIEVPWALSSEIDYEAEVGLIIGKPGRNISAEDAYDHVWGYTIINDVTARDLQSRHKQWLLGKSIDTFCPMGPWIVSADEIDPGNIELSAWVNDELRQQANTRDLIFDIPTIIAVASASMTLETGDIIATGTPAGVGIGFSPPKFLKSSDVVRIAVEGIGEIVNVVR